MKGKQKDRLPYEYPVPCENSHLFLRNHMRHLLVCYGLSTPWKKKSPKYGVRFCFYYLLQSKVLQTTCLHILNRWTTAMSQLNWNQFVVLISQQKSVVLIIIAIEISRSVHTSHCINLKLQHSSQDNSKAKIAVYFPRTRLQLDQWTSYCKFKFQYTCHPYQ
jgi:hypothetical protein